MRWCQYKILYVPSHFDRYTNATIVPEPTSHSGITSSSRSTNSNRRQHSSFPSSGRSEIIDLTDSPPAPPPIPFFPPWAQTPVSRHIIDVDALDDYPIPLPPLPQHLSRPRPSPQPQRRATYLPSEDITRGHDVITLGDDQEPPTRGFPSFINLLRTHVLGSQSPSRPQEVTTHFHYHIHSQQPPPRFVPPGGLNYTLNAHHLYGDDTPLRDHPGFKDDSYTAPPPPRQGFTRSPKDNMALICPDCGDELGENIDVKKEVWIAKCGHAYCGSCAARQRQNKGKGVKAGRCIVDGCTKIISGDKGLMEVFL